jgi:uridine kinase
MTLIAIDGRAGAGKTTLAQEFFAEFSLTKSVQVVHMDDLYDGWNNALSERLTQTLKSIVGAHLTQSSIDIEIYNWNLKRFDSILHIDPVQIMILEGVGAGQEVVRAAGASLHWLDIDSDLGIARVLKRDGQHLAAHMDNWREIQERHFLRDRTRENALHIQRALGT